MFHLDNPEALITRPVDNQSGHHDEHPHLATNPESAAMAVHARFGEGTARNTFTMAVGDDEQFQDAH